MKYKHTNIIARNWQGLARFYEDVFDCVRVPPAANREGITHIAFEVDNVEQIMDEVLKHGGSKIGDITSSKVTGVGILTFVYVADPEDNIIELQSWK